MTLRFTYEVYDEAGQRMVRREVDPRSELHRNLANAIRALPGWTDGVYVGKTETFYKVEHDEEGQ